MSADRGRDIADFFSSRGPDEAVDEIIGLPQTTFEGKSGGAAGSGPELGVRSQGQVGRRCRLRFQENCTRCPHHHS